MTTVNLMAVRIIVINPDFYSNDNLIKKMFNTEVVQVFYRCIGQETIAISIITSGELFYGALNKRELSKIKKDLSHLKIVDINQQVCDQFIKLMSDYSLSHNLTVPDGLIAATAVAHNMPLYTLNTKDFKYIHKLRLWE